MPKFGHIAFVCPRFAEGSTVGGAETLLKNLAEHAYSAGWKVTFLTTCARNHFTWHNELPPGRRNIGNLSVEFFPIDENRNINAFLQIQEVISRKGAYNLANEETWLRNSVNSQALYSHLREHGSDYDLIAVGPYLFGLTYFASQIYPEKTVLIPCLHDEGFAYIRSFQKMFKRVRGIMFNTECELNLACRLYNLPRSQCAVVGMGLEPFEVSADAFAKRYDISSTYVVYSGRRESAKGTPLLLDYMAAFRERMQEDIKIVFTGTGPVEPPPELAPHVIDAGFVSEQEKHEAMAGALVFCHPSIYESLSIVILESWLARTPALVHANCEVTRSHCMRSHGGLWFKSYPEFEEELLLLIRNPVLANNLAEAGRNYVMREYAWPIIERKLLNALDKFHTIST